MEPITNTLKIVSIQHELAINIGTDLDLDKMLEHFMRVLQRRLSLTRVHTFICPTAFKLGSAHKGLHYLKIPLESGVKTSLNTPIHDTLIDSYEHLTTQNFYYKKQLKGATSSKLPHHLYTFEIGNVGWIILERKEIEIEQAVLNSLLTIFERLALSCIGCLQHKSLLDEIGHREEVEKTLRKQAYLDPLTSLPNRKMLHQQLRKELSAANRHNNYGAIFYFDLDRFKNTNDTLGHKIGDKLLIAVSKQLKKILREEDTLARVGGDEFVLLSPNIADNLHEAKTKAQNLAERLLNQFAKPFQINKHNVTTSISVGIAPFPVEGFKSQVGSKQSESLIHNADIAMYKVKAKNRNGYCFYESSMHQLAERHATIEKLLSLPAVQNELEVYCQPILDANEEIVAAEALLRWYNPDLGMVSPDEFIPIAEESGHIVKVGNVVINQVCKTLQQLRNNNSKLKYISINVSPLQFLNHSFVSDLIASIKKYNIPASAIKLEITEGLAISGMDETIEKMNQLIRHGFLFLLDDFGTGYSSLSYVHKLPLDTVKIDKSFISHISEHVEHQVIANAIIDIAERLNINCIAEGVETKSDIEYLKGKRITGMQGFHYYKPMPKQEFIDLMESKNNMVQQSVMLN